MHRVCRRFRMVEVEYAGEDLKGESGWRDRSSLHPHPHSRDTLVRFGFGVGIFQAFTVINAHFQ